MRRLLLRLAALIVPVIGFILARHPSPEMPLADERAAMCMFDKEIGWVPRPNYRGVYKGSREFEVTQNSLGLRNAELGPKTRKRVLVIGDSHAWGYDSDQNARFTELLAAKRPDIELVNSGVSGYGTDQEFLFLKRMYDQIKPDAVILIFTDFDNDDNSSDMRYGYNKPYFVSDAGGVSVAGVPVPRPLSFYATDMPWLFSHKRVSKVIAAFADEFRRPPVTVPNPTRGIILGLKRYLDERRVPLGVVMQSSDAIVEEWFTQAGVPWIGVVAPVGPKDHWTPEGHAIVASRLEPLVAMLVR